MVPAAFSAGRVAALAGRGDARRPAGLHPALPAGCGRALLGHAAGRPSVGAYRRHPGRGAARAAGRGRRRHPHRVRAGQITFAEKLLSPYLIASQAVPVAAIAPLLIIWFGPGMGSKVLICGLIVFFPVLINTIVGLRAVPENLRDVMRAMRATPRQTLLLLEIPAALPVFFAGLRVGATLSVIGAVVGELVGSDQGLGFLINLARGQYDTALVFVAVGGLVTLALLLYGTVLLLEKHYLAWQTDPDDEISTM